MRGRGVRIVRSIGIAIAIVAGAASAASAQTAPPAPPAYEQPAPAAPAPGTQQIVVVPAYGAPTAPQYPSAYGGAYATAPVAPTLAQPRMHAVQVERSESIRPLWLTGVIALPVSWLLTWSSSSSVYVGDAATYSWIPVLGPWLMLTQDLRGGEAPIVISGVVQGAATIMIVLGLALRRTWVETQYVPDVPPVAFDFTPLPGGGHGSVTIRM